MPPQRSTLIEDRKAGTDSVVITAGAASLFLLAAAVGLVLLQVGNLATVLGIAVLFAAQFTVIVMLLRSVRGGSAGGADEIFTPEIEEKLLSLEDAGRFLGGSLRMEDMFRLVVSKTSQIVAINHPVLLVFDEDGGIVSRIRESDDVRLSDEEERIAIKAANDGTVILKELKEGLGPFTSMSLTANGKSFAALCGDVPEAKARPERSRVLLEAVAERVAPVFFASLSYERKSADALVDHLTWLPNGRAFELVLENRVAEAKRLKEGAPLVVMAFDIKDFSGINSKFGHHTGDRALAFAAEIIRDQLRKMDLVARTSGDEFLAVLPGVKSNTAKTVIDRISAGFAGKKLALDGGEEISVSINFGSASFGPGRDTAEGLVKAARHDRDGHKAAQSNQVLRFPTKHSN